MASGCHWTRKYYSSLTYFYYTKHTVTSLTLPSKDVSRQTKLGMAKATTALWCLSPRIITTVFLNTSACPNLFPAELGTRCVFVNVTVLSTALSHFLRRLKLCSGHVQKSNQFQNLHRCIVMHSSPFATCSATNGSCHISGALPQPHPPKKKCLALLQEIRSHLQDINPEMTKTFIDDLSPDARSMSFAV